MKKCERCALYGREATVTTHMEWREPSDPAHWANQADDRCDRCAQDLRDYAVLGGISIVIVVDEPMEGRA